MKVRVRAECRFPLDAAYAVRGAYNLPQDRLLITDGEVWNSAAAATWGVQGLAIAGSVAVAVVWPERSGDIFDGLTAIMGVLSENWMYALAVLGVYVWKRSEDKKPEKAGLLASIAQRLRGGW